MVPITLILIAISGFIALRQMYWWQVKEYRWDRWWSWVHYNQGGKELMSWSFRRPVLTFRVALIITTWLIGAILLQSNWLGLIVWGYLGTLVGVGLTWPINEAGRLWWTNQAKTRLDQVKPQIIAITGSYGKSSSKTLLADCLSNKYSVVKTLKNENTEISIARRIIAAVHSDTQVLVVEVGAYRCGEIARICQIIHPDIAWITSTGNQHLDLFGGYESLKKAKFELIENLNPGGTAIFNSELVDADLIRWAKQQKIKTVVYSASNRQANVAGVKVVAKLMGINALTINQPEYSTIRTPGGITVIDDSYSTNQQGFEAAVDYLKMQPGRKYVVTPGIIELGKETERVHSKLREKMQGLDGVWMREYKGIEETLEAGDVVLIEGRIPSNLKQKILQL